MAAITRTEAIVQIQEVLKAYENKIRDIRFNTENLSPEGKNIVDSYCSNEKNEQVLVKKAYSKKKFFKKVNETQLLEFYKVCYELNKNLSLDVKELLLITAIEEDKESFWESFWGALQGEFNEDPSGASILIDMGLNFIPFVGQVLDARDILACLDKLIRQKRTHEIMIWVTLVLTAIGCVPYAGDVIKAIGKAIVKGADDIIITLLKKLDAEDVYKAFIKFYNKLNESLEEAIKIINQWLLEAEKRYNETDLSELIRNANEYINKAIEFIQTKIDEFAQKMFGKGNVATVVESVKKSPEEILQEAGYKKGKLIQDNVSAKNEKANTISQKYLKNLNKKSVKKITRREDGYEILKRYEEYFGDNVEFVNELIENTPGKEIYVEPEKLVANYIAKSNIFEDCRGYTKQIKRLNGTEFKKLITNARKIDDKVKLQNFILDEVLTPAERAASWQGKGNYPGVDKYMDIKLKKGDKIFILESEYEIEHNIHSGYATNLKTVVTSDYDSKILSRKLQIKPYYNDAEDPLYAYYRNYITKYTINDDFLDVAFGEQTLANIQFGEGGAPQYYIKKIDELISKGCLQRGKCIKLKNTKISFDEYDCIMEKLGEIKKGVK